MSGNGGGCRSGGLELAGELQGKVRGMAEVVGLGGGRGRRRVDEEVQARAPGMGRARHLAAGTGLQALEREGAWDAEISVERPAGAWPERIVLLLSTWKIWSDLTA